MAKKKRIETELALLMLRNMATVMEREQERRNMGKVEFAKVCGITAPTYLSILGGTANPTLFMMTRIAANSGLSVLELLHGFKPQDIQAS